MNTDLRTLEAVAAKGRLLGLDMVYHCASGHLGGSFSAGPRPRGGFRVEARIPLGAEKEAS